MCNKGQIYRRTRCGSLALSFDRPVSGWFQQRDSNVPTCCHLRCSNPSTRSHYCSPPPRNWAGFIEKIISTEQFSAWSGWGQLRIRKMIDQHGHDDDYCDVMLILTWCNAYSWHRALIWEAPETEGRLSVDGKERIIGIDFVQLLTLQNPKYFFCKEKKVFFITFQRLDTTLAPFVRVPTAL